MQPLSATDAIAPAWQHTRRLLLDPRSPRLFFKIAAVAFFAEMMSSTFSFSPIHNTTHSGGGGLPTSITAAIIGIIVVCAVVGLVIGVVFFYLSSRLQFTIFHIVLRSDTTVAPIWRRYGAAAGLALDGPEDSALSMCLCVSRSPPRSNGLLLYPCGQRARRQLPHHRLHRHDLLFRRHHFASSCWPSLSPRCHCATSLCLPWRWRAHRSARPCAALSRSLAPSPARSPSICCSVFVLRSRVPLSLKY